MYAVYEVPASMSIPPLHIYGGELVILRPGRQVAPLAVVRHLQPGEVPAILPHLDRFRLLDHSLHDPPASVLSEIRRVAGLPMRPRPAPHLHLL